MHIKNIKTNLFLRIRSFSSRSINISSKIRTYASCTNLIFKNVNVYHKDFAKETLYFYSDFLDDVKEVALKANEAANENLRFFDLWILVRISIAGQENYCNLPFKSSEPYNLGQIDSIFVSAIQKFVTDYVPNGSTVALDVEVYSVAVSEGFNIFETPQHIVAFLKSVRSD